MIGTFKGAERTDDSDEDEHRELRALELSGDLLATVVDEKAEVDGDVEVDAKDIGLKRGANAHSGLEVEETFDEGAALAWLLRELTVTDSDEAIEHIGAGGHFKRVNRAFAVGRLWCGLGALRRRCWASAAATGECKEEEVEDEKEAN